MGTLRTSAKPRDGSLYTVGHSSRTFDELVDILRSVEVTRLVDIRAFPRSRKNPQFNSDVLPEALAAVHIAYSHSRALGGRRGKGKVAESTHTGWQVPAFRNYADYATTEAFREGLHELLELAARETCAIMCAEAVWWRCHRRIVTDYVLAQGVPVVHLLSLAKHEPARLTPFAHIEPGGRVSYGHDAAQAEP